MRWAVLAVALLAVGCSKGREAEKRYNIVAKTGTAQEKCAAAQNTADAYLADKNESEYQRWTAQKAGDCASSALYDRP